MGTLATMEYKMTEEFYLIEVEPSRFFVGFAAGGAVRPVMTPYPSTARHLNYREADQLVGWFLGRGYTAAVVTDIFGNPVTAENLREAGVRP